jgi:hypothetical protein
MRVSACDELLRQARLCSHRRRINIRTSCDNCVCASRNKGEIESHVGAATAAALCALRAK